MKLGGWGSPGRRAGCGRRGPKGRGTRGRGGALGPPGGRLRKRLAAAAAAAATAPDWLRAASPTSTEVSELCDSGEDPDVDVELDPAGEEACL